MENNGEKKASGNSTPSSPHFFSNVPAGNRKCVKRRSRRSRAVQERGKKRQVGARAGMSDFQLSLRRNCSFFSSSHSFFDLSFAWLRTAVVLSVREDGHEMLLPGSPRRPRGQRRGARRDVRSSFYCRCSWVECYEEANERDRVERVNIGRGGKKGRLQKPQVKEQCEVDFRARVSPPTDPLHRGRRMCVQRDGCLQEKGRGRERKEEEVEKGRKKRSTKEGRRARERKEEEKKKWSRKRRRRGREREDATSTPLVAHLFFLNGVGRTEKRLSFLFTAAPKLPLFGLPMTRSHAAASAVLLACSVLICAASSGQVSERERSFFFFVVNCLLLLLPCIARRA